MSYLKRKLLPFIYFAAIANVDASSFFDENAIIDVELKGPLGSLIKNKKDRAELPFVLVANGVEHDIQVRVRGKSRLRVCDFPPLRLNFSESESEQSVFAGQDKLKLVTHCRNRDIAQTDALEEFAAYRIFGLISEVSFRVRLLRITYVDTDERNKTNTNERYAFLIESQSELADRVRGKPANVAGVSLKSLDDQQAALVYVFQYLIGNTDWSMVKADDDDVCCHNGDIIDISSKRYYVPYDFDLAGLVNANYAYPDPSLRIRKVTQRLYRGFCTDRGTLQTAIATVQSRKPEVMNLLSEIPGLSDDDIAKAGGYLSQFFARADEEKLLQSFERRCL